MKVMTILGTRPEIIRLSRVIDVLDRARATTSSCTPARITTRSSPTCSSRSSASGPRTATSASARSSFGDQIGKIIAASETALREERPDRLLLLGDTNSSLSAVIAKRLGIPVFHLEAGNRCYDDRVPEEVNRRVIDHSSDVLMPYTERSRANLLREGFAGERVFVVGNPIREVLIAHENRITASDVVARARHVAGRVRARDHAPRGERRRRAPVAVTRRRAAAAAKRVRQAGDRKRPSADARDDGTLRCRRRSGGSVVRRAVLVPRLRRARAERVLRPQRQRHGSGGVLHLPHPERHDPRHDRAARDDRGGQQHAERRGARDDPPLRAHRARQRAGMEGSAGVHRRERERHRREDRARISSRHRPR